MIVRGIILVMLCTTIIACGQAGRLYLPKDQPVQETQT